MKSEEYRRRMKNTEKECRIQMNNEEHRWSIKDTDGESIQVKNEEYRWRMKNKDEKLSIEMKNAVEE